MKKLFIGITLLSLFVLLGFLITSGVGNLVYIDKLIAGFFGSIRSSNGVTFMLNVTKMGQADILVPLGAIALVFFAILKRWRLIAILLLAVLITTYCTDFSKNFFERLRPSPMVVYTGGYSFPSGHTSAAAIVFLIIMVGFWSTIKNYSLRVIFSSLCVSCIVAVGISRMYLNVHWLTDVVGGVLLASGIMFILLGIASFFDKREK